MRNHARYEEQDELGRIGKQGALYGASNALGQFLGGQGAGRIAGEGAYRAGQGMLAQGLGDLLLGAPKEHGFMEEAKRGAAGGSIAGALGGLIDTGMHPKGMALIQFLMSKGMGKKAAIAAALGTGAGVGAGIGALGHGLNSGLMNYEPEEK